MVVSAKSVPGGSGARRETPFGDAGAFIVDEHGRLSPFRHGCPVILGTSAAVTEPLQDPARHSDVERVKEVLGQRADPNELARRVGAPLHLVAILGGANVARVLIEAGANVDARTQTR